MHTSFMEPMLPSRSGALEDSAFHLVQSAGKLAGRIHPDVAATIGNLVRSINCYYSNLIEGHNTLPRDIDRALRSEYAGEPKKRSLQLEAVAHIEVQAVIDAGESLPDRPATAEYARWIHREFCRRLPEDLLVVENPDTGEQLPVVPGELRTRDVRVGIHVPPPPEVLPAFLDRFSQAYDPDRLSRLQQVYAIAAAHQRFLWIHPFLDGNGRVARLLSHAALKRLDIGTSLWSVSRGLARNAIEYKRLLMQADEPRQGDLDGRGNLSESALTEFCEFFLRVCTDQVEFMGSLLEHAELFRRIELYVRDEVDAGRLLDGSYPVLREALLAGGVRRDQVPVLTGHRDRRAREVLYTLLRRGLLRDDKPHRVLRLEFPLDVVERWFPKLYPVN